jgi:hypothetical protein
VEQPDPNFFPELTLGIVDGIREIGRKAIGLCTYFPERGYSSGRGAAAMLDAALCPDEVAPPDKQLVLFEEAE